MLPIIIGAALVGGYLYMKGKGTAATGAPVNTTTSLTLMATAQSVSIKMGGTVGVFPPAGGLVVSSTPVLPPTTTAATGDKGNVINGGKQAILAPNAGNTGGILPAVATYNIAWRDAKQTPMNTLVTIQLS